MAYSESNLLVVNGYAGAGRAEESAHQIGRATGIMSMPFQDVVSCSPEELEELLAPLSTLFVLGGDGSTLTLLQLLFRLQQQNPSFTEKTVVALGSGGENVVAKHMHTFSRSTLDIVISVLEGHYEKIQLDHGLIVPSEGEEDIFFWNVHAGFSAAALYEIEQLRSLGAGDVMRRYAGVLRALQNTDMRSEIVYTLNGKESDPVLDFGVVAAQLPYWTSKVQLDVPEFSPAMLHTVATPDSVGRSKYGYVYRLLLEVISLTVGFPMQKSILTHRPLTHGDTLQVLSSPTHLAVDSEVTQYSSGAIAVPQWREKSSIFVAKMV